MSNWKKRIHILLLTLLVAFACVGCASEREKEQETLRQSGIAYMQKGEYENALDAFQSALDLSLGEIGETEVDICFYKAECFYMLGDTESALATYNAVIDYKPDSKAYFLRGNLYYSLDDVDEALTDYENAVEVDRENYELYIGIYESLVAHDRMEDGEEYLEEALKIQGTSANDKMQQGRIHFLLGDNEKAVSLLKEAVGEEVEANLYLGEVYLSEGKYEDAITCLENLLQQEEVPNKQTAMKNLVIAYEYVGDFEDAKALMMEYVKLYPRDEEAAREYTFLETR